LRIDVELSVKTLHRIYDDYDTATAVVSDLEAAGFTGSQIALISRGQAGRGAENGAVAGALIGGGTGLLAGLGVISIPGAGPLVAAGWLLPLLVGAALGALAGTLLGALTGSGGLGTDGHGYAEALRRGGALVIVRAPDRCAADVVNVLERHHPSAAGEGENAGWQRIEDHAR
jgi:hypothetical protein